MDDLTAAYGGIYTCEPGTSTVYYDGDLDGNVDEVWEFSECWYDDCSEDDDDDDDYWDDDALRTPGFKVIECPTMGR